MYAFPCWLLPTLLWAQTPSTIQFGCAINAQEQIRESQALAKSIASPGDPQWRAKGDLHRKYHFPAANADMPYRLYVPTSWDGKSTTAVGHDPARRRGGRKHVCGYE